MIGIDCKEKSTYTYSYKQRMSEDSYLYESSYCIKETVYQRVIADEMCFLLFEKHNSIWATTWQNQQNECAPSKDSDQPGHPPCLIRVFAAHMKKHWVLIYPMSAQWRLWSDWADAQVDLSLRWAHTHFVRFVMSRLIYTLRDFLKYLNPLALLTKCLYQLNLMSP